MESFIRVYNASSVYNIQCHCTHIHLPELPATHPVTPRIQKFVNMYTTHAYHRQHGCGTCIPSPTWMRHMHTIANMDAALCERGCGAVICPVCERGCGAVICPVCRFVCICKTFNAETISQVFGCQYIRRDKKCPKKGNWEFSNCTRGSFYKYMYDSNKHGLLAVIVWNYGYLGRWLNSFQWLISLNGHVHENFYTGCKHMH